MFYTKIGFTWFTAKVKSDEAANFTLLLANFTTAAEDSAIGGDDRLRPTHDVHQHVTLLFALW